jgi:hypothetical protein
MNSYVIPAQPSEANPASQANPARFVVDLGSVQRLNQVFLGFIFNQTWTGGSVEVSTDNVTWHSVFNQTTPLGSTYVRFGADAQYVRVSSYGGNGGLSEVEIYNLPEPAGTLALIGLATALCSRRKRVKTVH